MLEIKKPVLKEWYDYLAEGKIMGLKCKRCGAYEFPPVPICNACSCTDMEWVEMSGEGELITFSYSAMGSYPYDIFEDGLMCGFIRTKEGAAIAAPMPDMDMEACYGLLDSLPVPVKAEIMLIQEEKGIHFPVYRVAK